MYISHVNTFKKWNSVFCDLPFRFFVFAFVITLNGLCMKHAIQTSPRLPYMYI